MIGVTVHVMFCSARNRFRRRLQRLREPRYLLGALAGSAYLYFAIIGRGRSRRRLRGAQAAPLAFLPLLDGTGPTLAGLAILTMAILSLAMPFSSGLLEFTKAETEFLFPAPLSRRQLLFYRLFRSQWAVVFSALIIAITYPVASMAARGRGFAGVWLLLMICHLFFTGVTLTRRRPAVQTLRTRLVAWLPRVIIGVAVVTVAAEAWRATRGDEIQSAAALIDLLATTAASGASRLVLFPFVAVALPLFADNAIAFIWSLPAALVVYGALIAWVLSADASFAVAADEMVEAQEVADAKPKVSYRVRGKSWTLALNGRPETAFMWKAALQTFRVVSRRLLLRALLLVGWIVVAVVLFQDRARGLGQVLGIMAAAFAAFAIMFGPQIVRLDLRHDLQRLDLLKTWPVRGSAVVRGQLLWPGAVVTLVVWTLGLVALILSASTFSARGASIRLAAGWSAMIVAPGLVFAQLAIHNAAALLFPAWVSAGAGRPRGVDAMGQRLIMMTGVWLVLALAVVPSVIVGGVLWIAFYRFIGPWILIVAGLVALVILVSEVLLATELLGPIYERLDLSSLERAES